MLKAKYTDSEKDKESNWMVEDCLSHKQQFHVLKDNVLQIPKL